MSFLGLRNASNILQSDQGCYKIWQTKDNNCSPKSNKWNVKAKTFEGMKKCKEETW